MTDPVGSLYSTQVPDYGDTADIKEALRLYHYGAPTGTGVGQYDINNTDPENLENPSIAYFFHDLQSQIDVIASASSIPLSAFTVKGSLLVGTGSSTYSQLTAGSDGLILTANSGATNGIEWALPEVTQTNTVSLTNKTLTSPNINTPKTTIALNNQSGTTYTFVASDRDKLVTLNNSAAITVTIPVGVFSIGEFFNIQQVGLGQVTVENVSGTGLTGAGRKLRTQYSAGTIICVATETFTLVGDIV